MNENYNPDEAAQRLPARKEKIYYSLNHLKA
jgi:hypothetical protein